MMRLSYGLRRVLLTAAVIVLLAALLPAGRAYAGNPENAVTQVYTLVNGEKVYVLDVGDLGYYLFLPSEADISGISLYSDTGEQVLFKDGDGLAETVDLSESVPNENNIVVTDFLIVSDPDDPGSSEAVRLNIMKGENIGTVYYTSNDSENNGLDWIDASKSHRGTGTAVIIGADGQELYNGKIDDIHIRGNSSLADPKKGYQIKLSKKAALVGDEKGKKWVLLAQYKDPLRMSDYIMKGVAKVSDDRYSADATLVNLYYDGRYRGVYDLSEKNEVKSNRIDITDMEEYYEEQYPGYGESTAISTATNKYGNSFHYQEGLEGPAEPGGYLFEMNSFYPEGNSGFFYTVNDKELYANMASPEYGSKEAIAYISEYFQEFVNAVYGSEEGMAGWDPETGLFYYDYCDPDSLVNSYLLQTVCSNADGFWKSQYFYKDVNEIMHSGPIWDLDLSFGTSWDYQNEPDRDILAAQAISGSLAKIPNFRNKLKERYFDHYQSILASLLGEDDKVPSFMDVYESVKPDLLMDSVLWPVKFKCGTGAMRWAEDESLDTIAEYRVDWIRAHKAFLDSYFESFDEPEETSHIYGEPVYEDEEHHKRVCVNCGEAMLFDHVWDDGAVQKEATCTEEGSAIRTCTVCGGTVEEVIPIVPHSLICVEAKQPTYEADGNIEYYVCSVCGKLFRDDEAAEEISEEDTVIPMLERPVVYRFFGRTRYDTAIKAADEFKAQLGLDKFDSVIVACGTNYADALAGSYLSSVKKAPILLVDTRKDHIDLVRDYIKANLASGGTVYLLGGSAVVPESVKEGLDGYEIIRLWGSNRYETNIAILNEAGASGDEILVCSGTSFADSLSAAAAGMPILLVKDQILDCQKGDLEKLSGKSVHIIGGTGAVSEAVESELKSYGTVDRTGGKDRYETSAKVAERFFDCCEGAVIAYGRNFPDGLCGGALANTMGVPLLLAAEGKTEAAQSFLAEREVKKAAVLGGPLLISDESVLTVFGYGDDGVMEE